MSLYPRQQLDQHGAFRMAESGEHPRFVRCDPFKAIGQQFRAPGCDGEFEGAPVVPGEAAGDEIAIDDDDMEDPVPA